MDFELTDEQDALASTVRDWAAARCDVDTLRRIDAAGTGFDRAVWDELAEMGVFGLTLPEADGGVGLGLADAALVFEELGRALVPGPILWTHLAAPYVGGAADGSTIVAGLDLADADGGPLIADGVREAHLLLVVSDDGVELYDPLAVGVTPVADSLDPLAPISLLDRLSGGDRVGGPGVAADVRRRGAVLTAAQALGVAEGAMALAVEYAKVREQFGRAIGSFQSIKHLCADMLVKVEVARAAVYAAGATFDDPSVGDLDRAVAAAKLTADAAATSVAKSGIQVHGGMGYTWEVPAHYFLKRAWSLATQFGAADEWAERVAADLGGDAAVA